MRGRQDGARTAKRVPYEDEHKDVMVVSRLLATCGEEGLFIRQEGMERKASQASQSARQVSMRGW